MGTEKKYLDSTGLATLIGKIKVGIENAIKNIQQASTSTYGLTKLSSATDSDAENLAATPKAVKAVKTALDTMSDVVATKADKTALDNYVPLVGDSTIDGELEVASLKTVMVQSNDILGSVKDSTGNNYGTIVMCSPGSSEISASTLKNNGADLNNSAALNVSTSGADIFTSSYARSGSGAIYTASMYASPNSASLRVDDEDKETIITPNSLQIKDWGANPQIYIDINVDGITAPKFVTSGCTSSQFVRGNGDCTALSKSEVTTALGYTPPTTNTTYGAATTSVDGLMPKGIYSALKDGFVTNIVDVNVKGDYVQLLYDYASPNYDDTFDILKGEGVSIPLATTTTAGTMSAADKAKLDIYDYSREDNSGDITERLVWNITEDPDLSCINAYEQRIEKDDNYIVNHFEVGNFNNNNAYNSYIEVGGPNSYACISSGTIEGEDSNGHFMLDGAGCYANQFFKSGGTSTQILMADGSVKELNDIDGGYSKFTDAVYNAAGNLFIPSEHFFGGGDWSDDPYYKECVISFGGGNVANGLYWNEEEKEWVYGNNIGSIVIPYASDSQAGVMSAADKTKLDALETAVDALSSATHFIGISSTEISDGNTQKPTINNTSITKLQKGDIVIYGNKEFIWDDAKWVELGDITALAQKVTAIEEALETNKNGALSDTEVGTIFDNAWK